MGTSSGDNEGEDVGDKVRGVIVGDVGDSAGQNSGHGPPISSCIYANQKILRVRMMYYVHVIVYVNSPSPPNQCHHPRKFQ